ncbi:MAG: CDGSH iron-sulfur domain-containing protein [Rikenellaceae bacterium]|jgi:CDGSH-type Zn-finger protein|nr:CDGSH iron-sulfur domain-containing protein [Rikenellaceae bacterium]
MKIVICAGGPYIVTGNVPLYSKTIVQENGLSRLKYLGAIPAGEEYHLCRCGSSGNKPFCNGSHIEKKFTGTETADRTPYAERATLQHGQEVDLLDDDRCAFARFCHRPHGSVWELVDYSADPQLRREAIEGASECPTGRLTALSDGEPIEADLAPSISIVQDPQRRVSAAIYVTGGVPVFGADGTPYEVRNRMALCRCGYSHNKPFCDAVHVTARFRDGHENEK